MAKIHWSKLFKIVKMVKNVQLFKNCHYYGNCQIYNNTVSIGLKSDNIVYLMNTVESIWLITINFSINVCQNF